MAQQSLRMSVFFNGASLWRTRWKKKDTCQEQRVINQSTSQLHLSKLSRKAPSKKVAKTIPGFAAIPQSFVDSQRETPPSPTTSWSPSASEARTYRHAMAVPLSPWLGVIADTFFWGQIRPAIIHRAKLMLRYGVCNINCVFLLVDKLKWQNHVNPRQND